MPIVVAERIGNWRRTLRTPEPVPDVLSMISAKYQFVIFVLPDLEIVTVAFA